MKAFLLAAQKAAKVTPGAFSPHGLFKYVGGDINTVKEFL